MKKTVILWLLAVLAPMTGTAQSNIKAAFDAIINCSNADISVSHSFEKDTKTGVVKGQDDVYEFVLPANKMSLIKKALSAFDKDIPKAYSVKSGRNTSGGPLIYLHSEQKGSFGIDIDNPGYDYIYALFLAPKSEDPEGIYRYAYAMNYKESGGEIRGKLVVNYATSLMHRQGEYDQNLFQWKNGTTTQVGENGSVVISRPSGSLTIIGNSDAEQQSWFEKVMTCLNGIERGNNDKTNLALATKAYKLITNVKEYPEATDQDKQTIRQIIKTMRTDKHFTDSVLIELLRQCESAIK